MGHIVDGECHGAGSVAVAPQHVGARQALRKRDEGLRLRVDCRGHECRAGQPGLEQHTFLGYFPRRLAITVSALSVLAVTAKSSRSNALADLRAPEPAGGIGATDR